MVISNTDRPIKATKLIILLIDLTMTELADELTITACALTGSLPQNPK